MASVLFDHAFDNVLNRSENLATGSFMAMLCTSAYAPSKGTHQFRSDVTNEVVGLGYTAGGKSCTLTIVPATVANGNVEHVQFQVENWPSSTLSDVRYMVVYQSLGGLPSADPLLVAIDDLTPVADSNGTLTFTAGDLTFSL